MSDERRDSFYDEDISYDDIGSERLSEIYDRNSESTEPQEKLRKEITGLRQEIGYKDEMIDLLKIHNEACKKEKYELTSKIERVEKENEKYILLLEELSSSQRKRNGGNNKRIKNVSKRSTASHNHATRRHSSKR